MSKNIKSVAYQMCSFKLQVQQKLYVTSLPKTLSWLRREHPFHTSLDAFAVSISVTWFLYPSTYTLSV